MINSVRGPISPEKLGQTLMHEHFTFSVPGWFADASIAPEDYQEALKTNLAALNKAKSLGIKTIVDATPNDVGGRDPRLHKALSEKSGIHIICSTGLYLEHGGCPLYWKQRTRWGTDISALMAELFIKEINQGIGKTGVKPGVIKVGTGPQMSPYEEAVLKAAVVAQKATGIPIITHTEGPTGGIEQADFLIKEGADLKKVMIGHVSNSRDLEYHKAILSRGVCIGFDRVGIDSITPFEVNVKNISELCKQGHAGKIMLSLDNVLVRLGRPVEIPEKSRPLFANRRIDHISNDVLPALKSSGVTDEQVRTMMIENPRNLFSSR